MSDEDLTVYESSGNVFEDMGVPDADVHMAKAMITRVIRRKIQERGLTQAQAAKILGVKQPDVSDLLRGRLRRFSRERLERFLNALDMEIRVQVGPRPPGKARAGLTVQEVDSF